jgi:hypothetical protein
MELHLGIYGFFPIKIVHAYLSYRILATCHAHLIDLDSIAPVFGDG